MITLLPLHKILKAIAIIYAVIVALMIVVSEDSGYGAIWFAIKGAFILEMCILVFVLIGWRWLWSTFPKLNKLIYPDLSGEWDVTIHWSRNEKQGTKKASAHIKQNFFKLSMELISDESESETLMVKPKKDPESSRPILYYIYRNESAQGAKEQRPPHKGAAILKVNIDDQDVLKGNYFTDHATSGHFELRRKV